MDLGVILAFAMFAVFLGMLLIGYNVAFCFAGTGILFSFVGAVLGVFDPNDLTLLPSRWFPTLSDQTLLAIPFFVLMGAVLEQSGVAERLLRSVGLVMGNLRGGVAIAVIIVGTLLAAATGVVAATVIVMGLLSLPTMVKYGYDHKLATGAIVASGTLAQLLPPSLVLILLAQQMNISVLGLFRGALLPGLLMSGLYIAYVAFVAWRQPERAPAMPDAERIIDGERMEGTALLREVLVAMLPPLLLIAAVLYAIFGGIATPSESGAVGALGALVLAVFNRRLSREMMRKALRSTADIVVLVMTLLFASTFFAQLFERWAARTRRRAGCRTSGVASGGSWSSR